MGPAAEPVAGGAGAIIPFPQPLVTDDGAWTGAPVPSGRPSSAAC